MARAQNVLRHCRDDNKTFFRFVFVYSQSRKWNGNKTTIPEVVFACFAMLSVSLCGTFNRVAVHENKTKTFYCHFCNVSTHSEHAPWKATVSENLIHPLAHAAFCVSVWQGNGLRMLIGRTFQNRQHSEKFFWAFSYTETCSLRGSQTLMHDRFRWSQTRTHVRIRWSQTRRHVL